MTNSSLAVLVNREGGAANAMGDKLPALVTEAFAKAGGRADVRMLAAHEISEALKKAAGADRRVVVAGGDGTIAAAAQLLRDTGTELAILPLGTLNHFARDLGIACALEPAAELAVRGKASAVDIGEVNGQCFINNASVGLYPFMVKDRDRIRDRHGWPKWLASVPASWDALSRLRHHRLRIDMGRGEEPVVTPLLFVGNNRYSLEKGSVGSRESLTDGKLSVYAVAHSSRLSLLWFGMRAMIGLADRMKDFDTLGDCAAMSVRSASREIEIALDGEVKRLSTPLEFSLRSGALNVVVPE